MMFVKLYFRTSDICLISLVSLDPSILFASESLMDPRIQVKLDKYQKCGNIISQTSLLSSYTGSETGADSDSR